MVRGEGWEVVVVREFGIDMYTLLYLKRIASKVVLCSTGNSAQCYVAALDERGVWGRMDTCICMAESLCYLPETISTSLIVFQNKIKS